MFKQLTSFFPVIINLIRTNNLAKIILAIVLLLVVLLVVLPLIGKLKRKRIKAKETRDILKDLMVWRHVAQLAQGGDKHAQAKEDLSDNILKIDELLKQGFDLAALHGRGLYGVPWFMLLGEPGSGKSTLLEASELELVPSAEERKADPGDKGLPVRVWLGGKAVVCDISGSVFFDRWLEGSSAEWTHIIRQVCRKHYRKPLDGVILTIPADALLTDDGDLTRKKATLMANELAHLLDASGMRLPCYVVVTKLDMVNGFREYAQGLSGELRHQILGYENKTAFYRSEDFKAFWNSLLGRFRSGYKRSMISRDIQLRISGASNRMDVTGKLLVFPDNFDALYQNLHIYLETLFSEDTFHGTKDTVFDGLFFTSATDLGFSFSPGMAALAGKTTEDLLLSEAAPPVSQSYFIRDMLQKFIFNPSPQAVFVRKEALNRAIPLFAFCGLLIILSFILLFTAFFRADDVTASLAQITAYYQSLAPTIGDRDGAGPPLIIKNRDGTFAINTNPSRQNNGASPVQFYYNALAYRNTNLTPSLGFLLSDLITFGEFNMGRRDRIFITNQLYGSLIRTPLIKSVGSKLIDQSFSTPLLDRELRSVIESFTLLDELARDDFQRIFRSNQYDSEVMIAYILPELSNDSRALLNSFIANHDRRYTFSEEAAYVYSNDFLQAKGAALQIILSAWQRLSVYPDSLYGKIKNLVSISQNIVTNYGRITLLLRRAVDADSLRDVENLVAEWKDLSQTQTSLVSRGREIFAEIKSEMLRVNIPLGLNDSEGADPFGNNLINDYLFNDLVINYAVKDYTDIFKRDMDFIRKKSTGTRGIPGAVSLLEQEFSRNLTRELENLRTAALSLKSNELLSQKMTDDPASESLFMVVERILTLAGAIDILDPAQLRNTVNLDWMSGQYDIIAAFDNYESYVKPYAENEKTATLIGNGRIILAAQAYLNRYLVLSVEYDFLSSSPENISAMIALRSEEEDRDVFSLTGRAIQSALGGINYNRGYDPIIVKEISDGIAAYNDLFTQYVNLTDQPHFLQNQDGTIYQTEAFSKYLGLFLSYWGNYPDNAYIPSPSWREYRARVDQTKPYQINSVLQSLYTECIDILNDVNDIVLSEVLKREKTDFIASMNDRIKMLSAFMSADADRMLTAWGRLPPDAEAAFKQLRALPLDEIKETYMTVYSDTRNISIGWWNDFIMDGVGTLSRTYCGLKLAAFAEQMDSLRVFPLVADAPRQEVISISALEDLAPLLKDMGAGDLPVQPVENEDPLEPILHPILFRGSAARTWAQTIYQFAVAAVNSAKPLTWTLSQPPIDLQGKLSLSGRLLAVSRFRYLEASVAGRSPRSFNTYTNEKISLAEGSPVDQGITLRFYRASMDRDPAAVVAFNDPWSIFDIYLQREAISDGQGGFYFPVFVADGRGQYVYFTGIDFSAEIPGPDRWYTTVTWPNLRIVDGMVTVNR
ncbi:type VI secretion system protein [Treponema sp. TIM-1]|uniref:type VI secretion system protein n=1 Tax=Treponema sp. TIM-1 TaxID=2898417 RepID=UPI00398083C7